MFDATTLYNGIYRDDGFVVFKGKLPAHEIKRWMEVFQVKINDLNESEDIIFTAKIWKPADFNRATKTKLSDTITVVEREFFPYLDLEIYWNDKSQLQFKVHMKKIRN